MMRIRTALKYFCALPLMLTVLTTSACSHGGAAQASQGQGGPPATAVDVTHAAVRDLAQYALIDGQIAPSLSAALSLQQAGTIMTVNVQEGDRVHKGDVLAQIDDRVLRAQLAQNQAAETQAVAHLQSSNLTTPINGAQVNSGLVAARQQLAEATNSQRAAQAALRSAQVIDTSDARLLGQGYVAQTTYEQNHATFVSAQQAVASAEATVKQDQAAVVSAERNIGQIGVQAQDVAANRGALAQARAQVEMLSTQIDQAVLRAPFDGVVTARMLDPGAYAGPNQPILQLAATDPIFVNFDIPDSDLALAQPGTPVSFTLASGDDRRYAGTIRYVDSVPVNGTLQYRVRVVQSNPENTLRGGMLVSVALRTAYAHDALVVPRSAIGRGMDGASNIFVVGGGRAHAVPVTVGLQTDLLAQISGRDVHPGDVVVQTRPDTLADGAPVRVASMSEVPHGSTAPPLHPSTVGAVTQGASAQ